MAEKLFMTALSPTMERGTITAWHKKEGDQVKNGDLLCEVETDKAVMEYEADFDAVLLKIIIAEGQDAGIGDTIALYGEAGENLAAFDTEDPEIRESRAANIKETSQLIENTKHENIASSNKGTRLRSSPLARRMAEAEGFDINSIKGSGTAGRIIKRDIEQLLTVQPENISEKELSSGDSYVSVGAMRGTIAKRLTNSKFTAPHYYLKIQADMRAILSFRKEQKLRHQRSISINSILIKLASAALKKHPGVNSSWEGDKIRFFGTVDIGFAVALKDGLIAPVVSNCESKGIIEINDEFHNLAAKAKDGTLIPSEYSGAGFSISNLGGFGIEEFTAIINPPGSAILAIGAIIRQPVVVLSDEGNEEIVIRPMCRMTLSCDHRLIDGAAGAAFLSDLKRMIEEPLEALL